MTNPGYQFLTDDEKTAIKEATIRNLEYQMYQSELQVIAEKARKEPDQNRLDILNQDIAEKQAQIEAIKK